MNRRFIVFPIVIVMFVLLVGTVYAHATHSEGDMLYPFLCEFNDPPNCVDIGDVTLIRNHNGITMEIDTHAPPEHAVTIWWIVFNNPEYCAVSPITGTCGPDDLGNPAVAAAIGHAAGHVVDSSGQAGFGAHLSEGDALTLLDPSGTLMDAEKAEVHLVMRSHGPIQPGLVPSQIMTFGGGCTEATGGVDPYIGDFDCFDVASVAFLAP